MAKEIATARDEEFILVNLSPDVCLTPIGDSVVPVPYAITHRMDQSQQLSPNVFFRGKPAFLHAESYVDNVTGDEPGVVGGVVSGVNMKISHSIEHSGTVFINGQPMVRTGDRMWMNWRKP